MLDWSYFWNLIWSFFMLLSLVFIPVFTVFLCLMSRTWRTRAASPRPRETGLPERRPRERRPRARTRTKHPV